MVDRGHAAATGRVPANASSGEPGEVICEFALQVYWCRLCVPAPIPLVTELVGKKSLTVFCWLSESECYIFRDITCTPHPRVYNSFAMFWSRGGEVWRRLYSL